MHTDAPAGLYDPARHPRQVCPNGLYEPGLQAVQVSDGPVPLAA